MAKEAVQEVVVEGEESTVDVPVIVTPATKKVKVKGTWTMYYGGREYDFVDRQSYELPIDLVNYLAAYDNIYDTV
jgi:hypothetical protein